MRVLYDMYWWSTGPVSGRVVAREVLRAWREAFPDDEFVLATRPRDRAAVAAYAGPGVETVSIVGRPHGVATLTQYAWHARRRRVDVAYTQNFAPPGVWTATFIHDVMYQTNPEWFTGAERAYFWLIPRFARGAELVLTSSRHEADRIAGCNPRIRRVEPIGLSVATALTDADPVRPAVAEGVGGFLLTVGRLNVRKNLALTLRAAVASEQVTPERPLVVVAARDGKDEPLPPEVEAACARGAIRFVPFVSDAELAWLYQHAELFLYLALDEGFGLPPVEALHWGCPAVVSDIEVFHENLAGHVTYVDPRDAQAVAAAIKAADLTRLDPPPRFTTWRDVAVNARSAIERARGA
jgi:glycosyltransferase involved in cell wall biosynthesis